MKKTIVGLLLVGFVFQSYAQDVLFEAKLKKEEVPSVIIENIEEDYPDFIVDEYTAVPLEFIENDVIVDRNINSNDDYSTYQVTLKGKGEILVATYNKNGELLSTVEHGKNVELPKAVAHTLAITYPGWNLIKDNYKMVHYKGLNKHERYKIILENSGKKIRVYTDANGKFLKAL